jgi:polysaccharide pyruvyl transferase WcaK-like protein
MKRQIVTCNASSIAGVKNFGDELLRDLYRHWIGEADPDASLHHVSVGQLGRVNPASRRAIASASVLVFTGGGYFADGGGSALKRRLRGLRNRAVYGSVFRLARANGVSHAVLGVEVGAIASALYRREVRALLSAARPVVVRNAESRQNALDLLQGDARIAVHIDAALAIGETPLVRADNGNPPADRVRADDLNVAVHVHDCDAAEVGRVIELVRAVLAQREGSRTPRLHFLHDQRRKGVHPVGPLAAELALRRVFPDLNVLPYENPLATIGLIGCMDVVLTTKLHVGVVARALGVPTLAVGSHPKIRRFYEAIGEGELCGTANLFLREGFPELALVSVRSGGRRTVPVAASALQSALQNREAVCEAIRVPALRTSR